MTLNQQPASWVPRSYQETAVGLAISQACLGLLLPPGMGKTTIVYAATTILQGKQLIKKVLVIAPLRVCYNVWPRQKNAWKEFAHLRVSVAHGRDKEQALRDPRADIVCINPEGLDWLCDENSPSRLEYIRKHFDVLVVDESTKFKNTGTKRFKLIRKFIKFFQRRYILTGTFTPNGLLDLFGQVYILDEGGALGRFITHFRTKYFYPTDYMGYNLAPHSWAPDAIAKKIAPLTLVLKREDHLVLPELLFNDIEVELPEDAKKKYKQMEDTLIIDIANDEIIAANAAVATSKCRQIANGGVYSQSAPGEWEDLHDAKLDALDDLIEELSGESLLIVYEFDFDIQKIQKRFPAVRKLTTNNSKTDSENIAKFSSGEIQLGAGQFSSISLGVDGLQNSCRHICMYGLTWNLQDYIQTIDRVYRQGTSADTVIVHRIVAKDTLDERVIQVLNNKDKTQSDFLKLLKDLRA